MKYVCALIMFSLLITKSTHCMGSSSVTAGKRCHKEAFSKLGEFVITLPDGSKFDATHYIMGTQAPATDQEVQHIKQAIRVLHQHMEMRYKTALQLFSANEKDSTVCYQLIGALMKQRPDVTPISQSTLAELEAVQQEQEASINTIKMLSEVIGQHHIDLACFSQN